MSNLTEKQKKILDFIEEAVKTSGIAPTFRDISTHFGFSSLGTVHSYIRALKKKGFLEEGRYAALALRERKDRCDLIALQVIGEIRQGKPPKMFNESFTSFVPRSFILEEASAYLFIARGEDFHDELIADGDLLVVQTGVEAEEGDAVFATMEGLVYIKNYFPEGDRIRLESKKRGALPLIFKTGEIEVQGIITAVIRQY